MKIFVDKLPTEPKECLFNAPMYAPDMFKVEGESKHRIVCRHMCCLGNVLCDFEKGHKCNKLKLHVENN